MCYWHVLWGYHDIQSNKNLFSNNNEYHSYCVLLTRYNNFQRTQIIKLHNYEKEKLQCNGTGSKAIIDSMNFSKRDESQIFIEISPHVDAVQFYAYQGRWDISKERVFDFHIYARGNLSPTVKEAKKVLKPIYDFIKENSKK